MGMKNRKTVKCKIKIPALKLRYRLLLYAVMILSVILSLINVSAGGLPYAAGIACYSVAAVTLAVSCCYLILDIKYGIREKIKPGIEANPYTSRVVKDYRYRTVIFSVPGLIFNMVFAVFNGVIGLFSRSPWFGTLSAYYILLSAMRFNALRHNRRLPEMENTGELILAEISVYRSCGILLVIMTAALGGAVILLVNLEGGKNYPGFTIYAVAAYAFYKIIISVIHVVKSRMLNSPLLVMIRDISYIDACVSILSLQTAMFAAFGEGQEDFIKFMNGMTGTAVCLMTLAMGIHMIHFSGKMKRRLLRR